MIVASLGMFFAVASSAFVLRARMAHCRDVARTAREAPAPVIAPAAAPTPCGEARIVDNGDGTSTITFDACNAARIVTPDGETQAIATPLPDDVQLAIPR